MTCFTQDFIAFFEELSANNHQAWFDDNRKRYQESVKKPFESFVNEMILRLQEAGFDCQQALLLHVRPGTPAHYQQWTTRHVNGILPGRISLESFFQESHQLA